LIVKVAILTVSDRSARGERPDTGGPALEKTILDCGWEVVQQAIVPDSLEAISKQLISWTDEKDIDLILTTGGTGFSPRDITPEATSAVVERLAPGLAEAMRQASLQVTPHAMLSRAVAGIRKHTMIVNLPGSPKGAVENLAIILPVIPHAVELLRESPQAEVGHQFYPENKE
jgi:molybdopterin adenylyltransferase